MSFLSLPGEKMETQPYPHRTPHSPSTSRSWFPRRKGSLEYPASRLPARASVAVNEQNKQHPLLPCLWPPTQPSLSQLPWGGEGRGVTKLMPQLKARAGLATRWSRCQEELGDPLGLRTGLESGRKFP